MTAVVGLHGIVAANGDNVGNWRMNGMKMKWLCVVSALMMTASIARAEDKPASLVDTGKQIVEKKKCSICHTAGKSAKPLAEGAAGKDEAYLKGSLVDPKKTIGPDTKMPSYKDKLSDDEVKAVVEYLKSLK